MWYLAFKVEQETVHKQKEVGLCHSFNRIMLQISRMRRRSPEVWRVRVVRPWAQPAPASQWCNISDWVCVRAVPVLLLSPFHTARNSFPLLWEGWRGIPTRVKRPVMLLEAPGLWRRRSSGHSRPSVCSRWAGRPNPPNRALGPAAPLVRGRSLPSPICSQAVPGIPTEIPNPNPTKGGVKAGGSAPPTPLPLRPTCQQTVVGLSPGVAVLARQDAHRLFVRLPGLRADPQQLTVDLGLRQRRAVAVVHLQLEELWRRKGVFHGGMARHSFQGLDRYSSVSRPSMPHQDTHTHRLLTPIGAI